MEFVLLEQQLKKKNMWFKLGFDTIEIINEESWPQEIETIAENFHLPKSHALTSNLIPKCIKSAIACFDVTKHKRDMTCLHSDEGFLSLGYYSNNWFVILFTRKHWANMTLGFFV
jgi:hypothetical protein